MLRYDFPSYRLPRECLQDDIDTILSVGVTVHTGAAIRDAASLKTLTQKYDAVYIAIGAHANRSLGIEGENASGVVSAVEMLWDIGNGTYPDFQKKRVIVIGGGNVAMDAARSSVRLGAGTIREGEELAGTRAASLYGLDHASQLRYSHENPSIVQVYQTFLDQPLSHPAHALLHTDHHAWFMPHGDAR